MLDEALIEIGKQIPALVVLAILTIHYLRSNEAQATSFAATVEKIQRDPERNVVLVDLRDALRENTKTLGRVLEHLDQEKKRQEAK